MLRVDIFSRSLLKEIEPEVPYVKELTDHPPVLLLNTHTEASDETVLAHHPPDKRGQRESRLAAAADALTARTRKNLRIYLSTWSHWMYLYVTRKMYKSFSLLLFSVFPPQCPSRER